MSEDFKKVLVYDDRLNVSDQISYGVFKGGQQMTSANFNAISQSTSSHTYNIQVPSESTLCDRRVLWQSTVILRLATPTANRPIGTMPIQYSLTDSLSAFPLHQLCTVMSASINNNTVSINMRDVLPSLLRFTDKRELQRYNGYTPVQYDTYSNYVDGVGSNNNALGGFSLTADNDLSPRGSWVLDWVSANATNTAPMTATSEAIYLQFTVSEPLLVSPFIFGNPKSNNASFYGIQNMNFIFNIGDASRVWRSSNFYTPVGGATVPYITASSVYSFTNSRLIFNFLTAHPDQMMPSRNIVGYAEFPRYITGNLPQFGPYGSATDTQVVRTSTIQLNQIPDKLIINVRKAMGLQTMQDPDFFLAIKNISLSFNNSSGILASATIQDLFRYSVENGSNQSFLEFNGSANSFNATTGSGTRVSTSGSLLILDFAKDIQLVESFYAPGSLGNFNLQIQMTVQNQTAQTLPSTEICLITMNSGIFVCQRGTCSTYTGILSKSDVLDASAQQPYSKSDVRRMVGGGNWLDTLKSVAGKVAPVFKAGLSMIPNAKANQAADVLGALGYGRSGGGTSGGARHKLEGRVM